MKNKKTHQMEFVFLLLYEEGQAYIRKNFDNTVNMGRIRVFS